jgi:MoaA/NifB/PqqE/SkfB family radical SAM enzyme
MSRIKAHFVMLSAVVQLIVCSPMVRAPGVQLTLFFVCKPHIYNGFGGHNVYFIFVLFTLFFFSSLIHIWGWEKQSWFLDVKGWQYTNILQKWSFTHCWKSVEHIRLWWQTCRILDGTCWKCSESRNVRHHKRITNMLDALTFCTFYFSHECNLICIAENFVILIWQYTMCT